VQAYRQPVKEIRPFHQEHTPALVKIFAEAEYFEAKATVTFTSAQLWGWA
jgi:hypothetical protein